MVCYSASPSGTPVAVCMSSLCFVTVTWWDTAAGTSVWHVLMKGWEPMFPRVAFAHRKVTLMSCWAVMCSGGWVKENIWPLKGSHTCWPVNHVALGCRRSVSHLSHRGFRKGVCVRIRYFCFLAFNVTAVLSFCLFPALSVVGGAIRWHVPTKICFTVSYWHSKASFYIWQPWLWKRSNRVGSFASLWCIPENRVVRMFRWCT